MRIVIAALLLATCINTAHAACKDPAYRQFDFWIGHWEVFNPKDDKVGENRIKAILEGCGLQENWQGTSGSIGTSLNAYDAANDTWRQHWTDNRGTALLLSGGLEGDSMVMRGTVGDTTHRIRWTPKANGSVEQHWQKQNVEGDWETVFLGIYRRKTDTEANSH